MIFYHIARNTVTLLLLRRRFGRWPTPHELSCEINSPRKRWRHRWCHRSAPRPVPPDWTTSPGWHRLRRHKIERGGQWWSGWNSGMLALVLHCQKCNVEWHWTVR